ncbi:MAG: M48 family metallopeptidase [Deferrisomatales bacterium]
MRWMSLRSRPPVPRPAFAAVLAAGCLLAAACAVNPVTGQSELSLLSEAQELRMGEQAYPIYTQMSEGLFQDPDLQAYVQAVGERLARVSHRPDLDYRFNVVNASEINAYALPGGKISITRGLLARMANEAQLASVLGHEIGHVTARHAAAGYTRQVLAGLLTSVGLAALESASVAGADLIAQGGMLATNLVLMKYSRDQERQADELGMEYLTEAGYHPDGMAQTMEILLASHDREPSAVESLFLSHPLTSERLEHARWMADLQDRALKTPEHLRAEPFRRATAHLRQVAPAYEKMDAGRKALAAGEGDRALALLEQATELAPAEALIWAFRAAAEAKADRAEAAYASARRAVELYPELYRARFTAGVLAFQLGKHRESLDHLDVAARLVPDQPPVAFYRGRNYEATGRRQEAAEAYAAVVRRVRKGPMAEYCYKRLAQWGYLRPQG